MSDKMRNYDAEILALANLTLRPRLIQEEELAFEILPEFSDEIKPLEIEVPDKKDVVMRLIKRIKKD
jgi:hypothetical protein